MSSPKRDLVVSIAFGGEKYRRMGELLAKSIALYSPTVEFQLFGDGDFTPYDTAFAGVDRATLWPKDYKYPKLEILTKLRDPETRYMFVDADCFAFCDLASLFDDIEPGRLLVSYKKSMNGLWDGVPGLTFPETCARAGIAGIRPYNINSGFLMWQGHMPCFDKALELIRNVNLDDPKGRAGDEYYLCAGMQLTETAVTPLETIDAHPIRHYWEGELLRVKGRLWSHRYAFDRRGQGALQHYGNIRADHWAVRSVGRKVERDWRKLTNAGGGNASAHPKAAEALKA